MLRPALATLATCFALLTTGTASAADAETREPDALQPRGSAPRHLALSLNPLALGIGRAGVNVELALAPHHELVVSGFGGMRWTNYVGGDTVVTRPTFGGELGYRYLFGRRAFEGAFVGASALWERVVPDDDAYGTMLLGGALDVGGQIVTKGGVLLGAGLGVQYTASTAPRIEAAGVPVFVGAGVLPRLLMSVGYAF